MTKGFAKLSNGKNEHFDNVQLEKGEVLFVLLKLKRIKKCRQKKIHTVVETK